jgi:hypothetical protein
LLYVDDNEQNKKPTHNSLPSGGCFLLALFRKGDHENGV